ncbi:hypothetical protein PHPALM_31158 [Phytophthora palmivora]|uniref:Uncharacterized protein n=1 Tax=Phytophthora palmivora TaxID=4796 RepID=A0A2P4X3C0_9STRA|nr:hypothetical protein PHPALM_31158 [Phytophthora palmivora]
MTKGSHLKLLQCVEDSVVCRVTPTVVAYRRKVMSHRIPNEEANLLNARIQAPRLVVRRFVNTLEIFARKCVAKRKDFMSR